MIAQELDALTQEFPECQIAALADISSRIILCASVQEKLRQERLDHYANLTADLLDRHGCTQAFAGALARLENQCIDDGFIFSASTSCLFLRSRHDRNEALFCVCKNGIGFDKFLQVAREKLNKISTVQ